MRSGYLLFCKSNQVPWHFKSHYPLCFCQVITIVRMPNIKLIMSSPMKFKIILFFLLLFVISSCQKKEPHTEYLFLQYVSAMNNHDFDLLEKLISEEAIWYLGLDTLIGQREVMGPLKFDLGAKTKVTVREIKVQEDTVECELVEHNEVLVGLGIDSLVHFPKIVFSDGKIILKKAIRPPDSYQLFQDSLMAFLGWLRSEDSTAYGKLFNSRGKFQYSQENGELMVRLLRVWRERKSLY